MKTRDLGLLFLRVGAGVSMIVGHGWGKVMRLAAGETAFPDPLGIGPLPSLILAAFAESLCALAVVAGFKTRWVAVPLVITMLVAALVQKAGEPFGERELALLYGTVFLALAWTGGGRYSVDRR